MKLFYPLDEPYASDPRKRQFVAVRMELDLFKELTQRAEKDSTDLSSTIRKLCRLGLKENDENEMQKINLWNTVY